MMNNNIKDIFSLNMVQNGENYLSQIPEKNLQEKDLSYNEDRILNKLSLRKKKIENILTSKRNINIMPTFQDFNTNDYIPSKHEIMLYTKNDFTSGDLYIQLKKAFDSKDCDNIKTIVLNLVSFFQEKKLDNIEIVELFMKSGLNVISHNNISDKKEKFPFAFLLFNIGLNTEDKYVYIYCFNFILNFSFISNDFCLEIIKENKINLILDKLIYFYPIFIENNNAHINSIENIETVDSNSFDCTEKTEAYYFGGQILKLLGNLYLSTDDSDQFETINFYDKIFYLITIFNLEEKNPKFKKLYFEYLETLIWLIILFKQKNENFILNYKDKLLMIIPYLLNDIKMLYFTQEIDLLERIIEFLDSLGDEHADFNAQMVDAEGIKILSNLFAYLFNDDNENKDDIILNSEIIDKILEIFINIFTLDSQCFKYCDDFIYFNTVIERLVSMYKLHVKNHFETQKKLIVLLSNMACFEDIEQIVQKIFLNKNIIKDLFKYYNPNHKKSIVLFIDNIFEKQRKNVRDFILDLGAFDILGNNICNYSDNNIEIVKNSLKAFHKLIEKEKKGNIRLLFEKIYNTAIPDKIKELAYELKFQEIEIEVVIKSLIKDFEIYEKSLNYD